MRGTPRRIQAATAFELGSADREVLHMVVSNDGGPLA